MRPSHTPEYRSWHAMMSRCNNPKDPAYRRYGGRGITVHLPWHDFATFCRDMAPRPEGLSLERNDNDGNYEPSNCRWATRREQGANMRSNYRITIGEETKHLYDWCRQYGLDPRTVHYRMKHFGWTPEQAVTTPKMRSRSSRFERG